MTTKPQLTRVGIHTKSNNILFTQIINNDANKTYKITKKQKIKIATYSKRTKHTKKATFHTDVGYHVFITQTNKQKDTQKRTNNQNT